MGGVAVGVEKGDHVLGQVIVLQRHHIGGRQAEVLRKGTIALHAHAHGVFAPLAVAGAAVAAVPADDVALAADALPLVQALDARPEAGDLAHVFVADDQRRGDVFLRPRVPVVDMYVGPADSRLADADQHLAPARLRHLHAHKLQPRPPPRLYERVHKHEHRPLLWMGKKAPRPQAFGFRRSGCGL